MNKKNCIIAAIVGLFFGAVLFYGIYSGDPDYVFKNATNFCFT